MGTVEIWFHHERALDALAIRRLYDTADWWPQRQLEEIAAVLETNLAVGAWMGEHVVGFARAISDGHFHAYIDDVIVHPDYRAIGVGSALLSKLLSGLPSIDTITLFCQSDLVPFYERNQFRLRASQRVLHRQRA